MKARLHNLWKGVKKMTDEVIDTVKSIVTSKRSRFISACIFGGLSIGLFASCYIPEPV